VSVPKIDVRDVGKRYGGVVALAGAHFEASAGEVHGLLGPNGSGKSTINKILAGSVRPDAGSLWVDGRQVRLASPVDSARAGIGAVYQQLTVIPTLDVEQNLLLGSEPGRFGLLDRRDGRARARRMLERLGPALGDRVRPGSLVGDLSPGQQQLIEIGKVLLREPRILILDEATASLHRTQVDLLFEIVRELRADGVCVLFVSHRLDEILAICDRATILRAGKDVATVSLAETEPDELVRLMVGEKLAEATKVPSSRRDEPVLQVEGLRADGLSGISFTAHAGEIIGLGGLQGQGQSELLMTLFGAHPRTGGTITLRGRRLGSYRAAKASRMGFALVPGNRGTQGMFSLRSIQENLSIVSLWRRTMARVGISMRRERSVAREAVEQLAIRIGSLEDPVSSLSGGNAQKVIVAKWLLSEPEVILLDDPTKGVDVGAKAEIYQIIRSLASEGRTIIINSSDDRELAVLSDRVLVLFEGAVVAELSGDEIDEQSLVSSALLVSARADKEVPG
jgi:ribose transport system ATP-binding protein